MENKLIWGAVAVVLLICVILVSRKGTTSKAEASTTTKTIACVGDSITFGSGVIGHRKTQSYPAILQQLVGDEYQVSNFGIRSRTLVSTGDFPYIKEKYYEESLAMQADIYIMMLGTNDSKPFNWDRERYETELAAFIQQYKETPNVSKLILMQPPKAFPIDGVVKYEISNDTISNEIRDIVAKVGEAQGCDVIDLYALTEDHPDWFMDGVHPNKEGNQAIAEEIAKHISE